MKRIFLTLIVIFLFIGCDFSFPARRPLSKKDSVQYLTNNSDVIAVVQIINGVDLGKSEHIQIPVSVTAKVLSVLKGRNVPDKIEIYSTPHISSCGGRMILYNGKHLVFLVGLNQEKKLFDDYSLIHVRDGLVTPIWTRDRTEELSWTNKRTTLTQAVKDVEKVINKNLK